VRCALCAVRCALCAVRCALCAVRCALCTGICLFLHPQPCACHCYYHHIVMASHGWLVAKGSRDNNSHAEISPWNQKYKYNIQYYAILYHIIL
jgi:hypothetical protein